MVKVKEKICIQLRTMRWNLRVVFLTILHLKIIGASSLDSILEKAVKDLNPYQIAVFTASPEVFNCTHNLTIANEYPSLKMGPTDMEKMDYLSNSSVLKNTLQTSLIVIYTNHVSFAMRVIDLSTQVISAYDRPKFLCFSLDTRFEKSLKRLLKYAWDKRILDFTLLSMNQENGTITSMMYNPFKPSFDVVNDTAVIFPDKLKSINKYPIYLGRAWPDALHPEYRDQAAQWEKYQVEVYVVLYAMNFLLKPASDPNFAAWENYSQWFTSRHVDLIGFQTLSIESRGYPSVPTERDCRPIVAGAPILYVRKVLIPDSVILCIVVLTGIILSFIILINHLKGKRHYIRIFDATQLLMGQSPTTLDPKTMVQKIIYVTVTILFVYMSNDLFSEVVKVNFYQEEVPFENLKDMDNYPFPIYVPQYDKISLFSFNHDNDPILKSLKRRGGVVD